MNMFFRKIGNYFLQGLLYVAPISVTGYIIYAAFLFADGIIPIKIPGLGLLSIFVFVTLTGFIGPRILTPAMKNIMNVALEKTPVIKLVYTSIKDLLSAFVGKEKKFTQPVLVRVNKISNLEKFGFLTQTDMTEWGMGKEKVAVFFPHSYAFTGELFIVPSEDVTLLDITSAEVMKFIVSGGVTKI